MPDIKSPQGFGNHARIHPPFHFFVMPVFLINVLVQIWYTATHFSYWALWIVVVSLAAVVAVLLTRVNPLRAQDRLIRLKEQLRLLRLLPESKQAEVASLSVGQMVALRFASDAELPILVERAAREKLTPKDIKKAIVNWRPDYFRV